MGAAQRIWLIGPMAVGKSTVGAALAQLLGWPYRDNDAELAASTGRPLESWPAGEPLHLAESRLLRRSARLPPPFVAGVAAGVGDAPSDLDLLRRSGRVVLLTAPVEVLVARAEGTGRPLGPDARATLTAQLTRRTAAYRDAAELIVDTADHAPADAAALIAAGLGLR